jgi:hypothetical protein
MWGGMARRIGVESQENAVVLEQAFFAEVGSVSKHMLAFGVPLV